MLKSPYNSLISDDSNKDESCPPEDILKLMTIKKAVFGKHKGEFIAIGKSIQNPRLTITKSCKELVSDDEEILMGYTKKDIAKIASVAAKSSDADIQMSMARPMKLFAILTAIFSSLVLISNILSSKLVSFHGFTFTGGYLLYFFTYAMSALITEVYGYEYSRQSIWAAILINIIFVFASYPTIFADPASFWHYSGMSPEQSNQAFSYALSSAPRIIVSSLVAFALGEFINSYIISKIKIFDDGGKIHRRIFVSYLTSVLIGSFAFAYLAFYGISTLYEITMLSLKIYFGTIIAEFLMLPVIIKLCKIVKKYEQIDMYDYNTMYTPFKLAITYKKLNNKYNQA